MDTFSYKYNLKILGKKKKIKKLKNVSYLLIVMHDFE